MKRILLSLTFAIVAVALSSGFAQAPARKEDEELLALVADVQAQQARMTENQTKIDSKMAEVTEAIRVARIFAGRGGK